MKRIIPFAIFLVAATAQAQSWLAAPASYTCRIPCDVGRGGYIVHTVRYPATNITICGLIATTGSVFGTCGDPQSYRFSDGAPRTYGTDMAAGAWGWPTGGTFSGTTTVAAPTITSAGFMPVGYACVGTTLGNVATITVGGSSVTVSNTFDVSIRGITNASTIAMTTTGYAKIGITQLASNEWYAALDGIGDTTGLTDATSINTNSAFLAYTWTCTASTNTVIMYWDKYGQTLRATNVYHISHAGCIAAQAQMCINGTAIWSGSSQIWRMFGWRAIYGPTPTAAQFRQMEIDARAEYAKRGWGQ